MSWAAATRWELTLARRSHATWAVVGILLVASALALVSGLAYRQRWAQEVARQEQRGQAQLTAQLADLAAGKAQAKVPLATRVTMTLPPAPLAELSTGRSDLEPRTATARPTSSASALFRDYQTASPLALATARFDLGFVLVYLLPISIIALGYNLLSAERERGLDRLWAVHGASRWRLATSRVLVRGALLAAPLALALLALALVDASAQRWALLAAVAVAIVGYQAIWWGVVLLVASLRLREMPTLLVLLLVWLISALLLPATFAAIAKAAHPPPSRFAVIATARSAEIEATKRAAALVGGYLSDHPELADPRDGAKEHPFDWAKRAFVVVREIDRATLPLLDRLDATLTTQRRAGRKWALLSPPLLLSAALAQLAGTDETRALAFRQQARAHLRTVREALGQRTMAHQAMTAAELGARPGFRFVEPAPLPSAAPALAALWLFALLLWAWARARLARWF